MKIRNICLGLALGALATGAAWATDAGAADKASTNKAGTTKATAAKGAGEVAVLETSKGKMVVEFWEKDAPQTVANFKKLARQGYYDGTGFHRIIKGFMIQGGDPKSKNPNAPDLGTGNPGYSVNDEFNAHKHVKGVISMANSGTPNSAGSQFFIMHAPSPSLDGKYTAFGRLISGMDVLDKIANSQTGPNPSMPGENSKPLEWTTLKSVKITSRALALGGAKKAEASRPAATKPAEVKAGMGAGAGMNMGAGEAKPASEAKPVEAKPAETQTPPAEATQPPAEKPAGEGNEPAPEGGQAK